MAQNTEHFNLVKPDNEDFYNRQIDNSNLDIIDNQLNELNTNKNGTVFSNIPPTNDDSGFKNGDSWIVPDITFNNLIKNPTQLKESDWKNTYCDIEISDNEIRLLENESGCSYAYATQNTECNAKPGHVYYFSCSVDFRERQPDYYKAKICSQDVILLEKDIEFFGGLIGGTFTIPEKINDNITIEIGFGVYNDKPLIGQDMIIQNIFLIDLTEDMGSDFEFYQYQAINYFENSNVFKSKPYEKSGHYICIDNKQGMAQWQKINKCADYPVERGTDGIWTWKKYASGDAKCWGTYYGGDILCNTSWSDGYTGVVTNGIAFPKQLNFKKQPNLSISLSVGNFPGHYFNDRGENTTNTGAISLFSNDKRTASHVLLSLKVEGECK